MRGARVVGTGEQGMVNREWSCRGRGASGAEALPHSPFPVNDLPSSSPENGAVAQLGERLDRTQEVRGSSPLSSIQLNAVPLGVTGNTPDSGSGESWFEPRRGNRKAANWAAFHLSLRSLCRLLALPGGPDRVPGAPSGLPYQLSRKAATGFTCVARNAGRKLARAATASKSRGTSRNTAGSWGRTP